MSHTDHVLKNKLGTVDNQLVKYQNTTEPLKFSYFQHEAIIAGLNSKLEAFNKVHNQLMYEAKIMSKKKSSKTI